MRLGQVQVGCQGKAVAVLEGHFVVLDLAALGEGLVPLLIEGHGFFSGRILRLLSQYRRGAGDGGNPGEEGALDHLDGGIRVVHRMHSAAHGG
ncbi:hypothetical protein D3C84_1011780 [compost metagenome]